jgi:hypothetical protein
MAKDGKSQAMAQLEFRLWGGFLPDRFRAAGLGKRPFGWSLSFDGFARHFSH